MAYPGSAFSPHPNRRLSVGRASATLLRSNLITCYLYLLLLEVDASGSSLLLRGFVRRMRGIPARAETTSGTRTCSLPERFYDSWENSSMACSGRGNWYILRAEDLTSKSAL